VLNERARFANTQTSPPGPLSLVRSAAFPERLAEVPDQGEGEQKRKPPYDIQLFSPLSLPRHFWQETKGIRGPGQGEGGWGVRSAGSRAGKAVRESRSQI